MLFLFVQSISRQESRYGLLDDVQYKNIARFFLIMYEKQPALRFLKVQAAFDRERSSENYFSDSFEIAGNIKFCWAMTQSPLAAGCITAWFGIIWEQQKPRACVPHTSYTSILRFA